MGLPPNRMSETANPSSFLTISPSPRITGSGRGRSRVTRTTCRHQEARAPPLRVAEFESRSLAPSSHFSKGQIVGSLILICCVVYVNTKRYVLWVLPYYRSRILICLVDDIKQKKTYLGFFTFGVGPKPFQSDVWVSDNR